MALSNWDTLAVTHRGESCSGVFVTPLGVGVEIYKNWLYVSDRAAWRKGGGYKEPIVAKIVRGIIQYADLMVCALRGPQDGVYVVAWSGWDYEGAAQPLTGMVGCGVYGYDDAGEFVGVRTESREWFAARLTETVRESHGTIVHEDGTREKLPEIDSPVLDVPDALRKALSGDALRFNQGDAYFANHLGHDVPATVTGDAQPTIMSEMLRGAKEDGR